MSNTVGYVRHEHGVAGQHAYTADVTWTDDTTGIREPTQQVTFVGSRYGGPVVMVTAFGQTYVSKSVTERLGDLSEEWVRKFFGTSCDEVAA